MPPPVVTGLTDDGIAALSGQLQLGVTLIAVNGQAVLGHEQAAAWPAEAEEQFTVVFDDVPRPLVEPVHVNFLARGIVQPEGGFEEVKVLDVVDRGGVSR